PRSSLYQCVVRVAAWDHKQFRMLARLLRERYHLGKQLRLGLAKELVHRESVFPGVRHRPHGDYDNILLSGIRLAKNPLQMRQPVRIPDCDHHAGRPDIGALETDFRTRIQKEFLFFVATLLVTLAVGDFGKLEDDKEYGTEAQARNGGHPF